MLNDILSSKTSLFPDKFQTVLRGQENRKRKVSVLNGNLVGNIRFKSCGLNARVYKDGLSGFASVGVYDSESADYVLREAVSNAVFLTEHSKTGHIKTAESQCFEPVGGNFFSPHCTISDVEQKKYTDLCMTVDSYIQKNLKNIISRSVAYTEDSQEKIIYSSDACSGHTVSPRCYLYVTLTAQTKDGIPVELYDIFGGAGSFDDYFINPCTLYDRINILYSRLMDKKEGVYADAGYKDVILSGNMAGMLAHEAVGHTVEADLVLGGSVALMNLNRQVASPLISMTDFANSVFGKTAPLPVFLDDEGIPAEDCVLIKDGILTGYMNNRETASHFGMKPMGNARAWDFSDEPLIRMRNTRIHPKDCSLSQMIESVEDGYYLMNSGNGQADLTGEFMFGVNMGYEIKNGKLGRAILDTTVSGVAFDMLKTVDMVGDTVVWESSGFCGKKQMIPVGLGGPDIKCKIMIGGR